jgi:hypothetical protein
LTHIDHFAALLAPVEVPFVRFAQLVKLSGIHAGMVRATYPRRKEALIREKRMAEAREKARLKMLQRIKRAAEDDWRAAAEFLRLSFPADYRRGSNTSVEVNTAVQTGIVISEEKRMALIAQRERILKAPAATT